MCPINLNAWTPPKVPGKANTGSKITFREYATVYVEKQRKTDTGFTEFS